MKRLRVSLILGFLFLLVSGSSSYSQAKEKLLKKTNIYFINETQIEEKEFEKFLQSLKEIENTYHCKLTKHGGTTTYEAKDKLGNRYSVRLEDGPETHKSSIEQIKP